MPISQDGINCFFLRRLFSFWIKEHQLAKHSSKLQNASTEVASALPVQLVVHVPLETLIA